LDRAGALGLLAREDMLYDCAHTMVKSYKIFFHQGEELGLKTRVSRGEAWIDASGLNIKGPNETTVLRKDEITKVELFRLHGLGRVIRIDHSSGTVYLAVVRFMIGQFASVNFFKTGDLHRMLAGVASSS
jgi:hypothetical protein